MTEGPEPKRLCLGKSELSDMTKDRLIEHILEQEQYVNHLESKTKDGQKENSELVSLRESEEKLKQQQVEATRRENVLVMRLTTKEQEMQEYANQIQELKQSQVPGTSQLRSTLLDPAVNLMFERMKKGLDLTKAKLEETQNDLSAWKFTPDSNTGKRLMAKCRLLHQENEELGKMISSGRVAKLEGDLALQRNFSEEMKKSQADLDEFLMELDEDVEGMQSTIYYLQQQLREAKDLVNKLQSENSRLREVASVEEHVKLNDAVATSSIVSPADAVVAVELPCSAVVKHSVVADEDFNHAEDSNLVAQDNEVKTATVWDDDDKEEEDKEESPLCRTSDTPTPVSTTAEVQAPAILDELEMDSSPVLEINSSPIASNAELNEWEMHDVSSQCRTLEETADSEAIRPSDDAVAASTISVSSPADTRILMADDLEVENDSIADCSSVHNSNGHDVESLIAVDGNTEEEESRTSLKNDSPLKNLTSALNSDGSCEDTCGDVLHVEADDAKDTAATVEISGNALQPLKKPIVNGLSDTVGTTFDD